jgi:hypothetical protein
MWSFLYNPFIKSRRAVPAFDEERLAGRREGVCTPASLAFFPGNYEI